MRVLVTGAGGLVGTHVTAQLADAGYDVIALVRRPSDIVYPHPRVEWRLGDIGDQDAIRRAVCNVDYVVHTAARKADEADSVHVNVGGMRNLLTACESSSVRGIVNFSTISVKFNEKGVYAQTKQEADDLLSASRVPSVTVKPSVIYGNAMNGIFGTLIRATRLPVIPVFGAGTNTFRPIQVDDVADAVERILASPFTGHVVYDLGGPDLITFDELARFLGSMVHNKRVHIMHLPLWLGRLAALFFGVFLVNPPLTKSNILGLSQDAPIDPEPFWRHYDLHPRSLSEGVALMLHTRLHEQGEPYVLLRYVFPKGPIDFYADLYTQALRSYGLADYHVSPWLLASPLRLGAFDAVTRLMRPHGRFQRKLLIASALTECSPRSAEWLLPQERSVITVLALLSWYGMRGAGKFLLGLCFLVAPRFYARNA